MCTHRGLSTEIVVLLLVNGNDHKIEAEECLCLNKEESQEDEHIVYDGVLECNGVRYLL